MSELHEEIIERINDATDTKPTMKPADQHHVAQTLWLMSIHERLCEILEKMDES